MDLLYVYVPGYILGLNIFFPLYFAKPFMYLIFKPTPLTLFQKVSMPLPQQIILVLTCSQADENVLCSMKTEN